MHGWCGIMQHQGSNAALCRKRGDRSPLAPWLNLLPRDFGTPLHYRSVTLQAPSAESRCRICRPSSDVISRLGCCCKIPRLYNTPDLMLGL